MRRASRKILSLYNTTRPSPTSHLQIQIAYVSSTSIPNGHNGHHRSTPSTKTFSSNARFNSDRETTFPNFSCGKTRQFQANTSHDSKTQAEDIQSQNPRQRRKRERAEIEEAFEAAKTRDEMLRAFDEMEAHFDERELGLACLKIGLKLDQEGEDPQKILPYAERALKIFDSEIGSKITLPIAMTLQLLGAVNYELKKFGDSLGYLNRANKILSRLQKEGSVPVEDIRPILHAVLLELANVQTAMGRREEALGNLKQCLELKELLLEKDCRAIGNANRDLAEACVAILNFKDSLPYCLKALDIHKLCLGNNSVEVAHDRKLLGIIYSGLDEHEKALEQNQLAQKIMKNWGLNSDLVRAEIDAANIQIALMRFDAAIITLKGVVQQTEKDSDDRALVFIFMAKALVHQDKFTDAKRCLEIASSILDKKEMEKPSVVSEAYMEIAMQYETMNEFDPAISLLKRALSMLETLPQEQHSEGSVSARIGWLLLLTGKVSEGIPYLENAAETLKESFGPNHFGVGYIYNNMGAAYLELDRPQSAAQMFAVAKEIMDISLGSHHIDAIGACQNLSKAYAAMGSYAFAIEFQLQAIEALEGHGPEVKDELNEARCVLEQLRTQRASGATSGKTRVKALPLPQKSDPTKTKQPGTSSIPNKVGLTESSTQSQGTTHSATA